MKLSEYALITWNKLQNPMANVAVVVNSMPLNCLYFTIIVNVKQTSKDKKAIVYPRVYN